MGNVNQKPQQLEDLHSSSSSSSSTFTCEICIEPVTIPNKNFNNNKCTHPFCMDCMIKYIHVKLEDNVSDIKCPNIRHQLFNKWCDVLCESAVLGFDRVYCPNRDCSALVVNECGGGGSLKRCVCPNCKKPFCFRCKVLWHAGYRCDETGEIMDRNDVAFGVLLERKKWMRCPKCRHCVACERLLRC